MLEYTLDTYHTPYYAAGYLMKQIQPRVGMICHYTEESAGEAIAEEGVLEPGIDYLPKPFTVAESADKVREILDR